MKHAAFRVVAEIRALRSNGVTMTIECRSEHVQSGDAVCRLDFELEVPDTLYTRAEYQIGSEVVVTMEPNR